MINFTNKNVLITGGSRGIGKACAKLFSDLNANVIITYKSNKVEADKTLQSLNRNNKHSSCQLDITKPADIEKVFESVVENYKTLDVVVNNAGVFVEHKINEISYNEWQQAWNETISTNLTGVSNLCFFCCTTYDTTTIWQNCKYIFPWGISWRARSSCLWSQQGRFKLDESISSSCTCAI